VKVSHNYTERTIEILQRKKKKRIIWSSRWSRENDQFFNCLPGWKWFEREWI